MDWIFDHLQVIFIVGGAIAYWLNQRRKANSDEAPEPHKDVTFDDPQLAERTRQIREEIRRKIEARAKGYPHEQPAPVHVPTPVEPPVIRRTEVAPAVASRMEARRQAEILEEQATLAEKLREAEAMRTAAARRREFEAITSDHREESRSRARVAVVSDLRDPAALRRAFVLREIIGPPVALR